ncbi:MAG: hypothetical protein FJW61_02225 [Actinobacteria bacterium]|nr:hypothetical protein [Actinomycetota bacterium]MBM3712366.1 hypothetical protein [Actinomycetota bacterium]
MTGSISCKGSQPYYGDGGEDSGIRCAYVFNSSLKGTIDLLTYKLTVYADDYVKGISGGVCTELKPHHYETTLKGILNEAATYINGTSSMGGTWTASR